MTDKELFISWLNDAYSTELAMVPVLENHAADAGDYPEIYQHKLRHVAETKRQAERLEKMITDLGGKVSLAKSITGKTLGFGKSVSTGMFSDELIKNFLADYAAEHLEIASYKSLIATAKHLGEHQCVPVLEEILAEEMAMASWLEEHIRMATVESIKAAADGNNGKQKKKSNNSKSRAAGLLKPSALVTILGVGAVGAGVTMLLRNSSQNKNDNNSGLQSPNEIESSNAVTGGTEFTDSIENDDEVRQLDVIISETVIIEEEPESANRRASGGDTF